MTTTTDLAALLAAIDQGQDECLPLLADALEEAGYLTALIVEGHEHLSRSGTYYSGSSSSYRWGRYHGYNWPSGLPAWLYDRLEQPTYGYSSRREALLSLARVMAQEEAP